MEPSERPQRYAKGGEPSNARSKESIKLTTDQSRVFSLLPSRSKSNKIFREWLAAVEKHGPLMTPSMAAAALALSRQRVHMFINENRIATVRVGDERLVPLAALDRFMSQERRNGRPSRVRRKLDAPKERRPGSAGK